MRACTGKAVPQQGCGGAVGQAADCTSAQSRGQSKALVGEGCVHGVEEDGSSSILLINLVPGGTALKVHFGSTIVHSEKKKKRSPKYKQKSFNVS